MTGSGERPEETRQSVAARQLREQLADRFAERYRNRPLRRWLMVEAGRNDVVLAGMAVVSLAVLIILSSISIAGLKHAQEDWHSWQPLLHNGISSQAIVIEVPDWGSDNRVGYMYDAATGDGETEVFKKWEHVTLWVHRSLEVGEEVSIIYDPADPSHSRIEGNQTYPSDFIVSLYGVCLFIPITVLMIVLSLAALGKLMVRWVKGQPDRMPQR